jgi:hypothetical protein
MSNEAYLQVSYFTVLLLCFGLGAITFLLLRRPFRETVGHLRQKHFAHILRKSFFIGIIFPALLGFLSVSFRSCGRSTYKEIVRDLDYLISKNQEQLSASLSHLFFAICAWCVIVFFVLWVLSRQKTE